MIPHPLEAQMVAILYEEMNAIHASNNAYWRRGKAATIAERSEYQRRQDRLEKIRIDVSIITLQAARSTRAA